MRVRGPAGRVRRAIAATAIGCAALGTWCGVASAGTLAFDPAVSPRVDICQWNGSGCEQPVVATFTTTTGPGSETVRVDAASSLYIVNWHTDQFALTVGATYRIVASLFGAIVGSADVQILTNGSAKNVTTGDDIALVDGKTLPIKFRIEQGIVVNVAVTPRCGGASGSLRSPRLPSR